VGGVSEKRERKLSRRILKTRMLQERDVGADEACRGGVARKATKGGKNETEYHLYGPKRYRASPKYGVSAQKAAANSQVNY